MAADQATPERGAARLACMAGRAAALIVGQTTQAPGMLQVTDRMLVCGVLAAVLAMGAKLLTIEPIPVVVPGFEAARLSPLSLNSIPLILWQINCHARRHPWKRHDRSWVRGTYYTGVMAAYRATGDQRYLDQALRWGREQGWQPGTEPSGANVLTCCQTYLEAYSFVRQPALIQPTIRWLDSGASNTPTGAEVWYMEDGQRYVDSLFTGPPALAMLFRETGDVRYRNYLMDFIRDINRELRDEQTGLYFRDRRFVDRVNANGQPIHWARGNGWALAGLARVLDSLHADSEDFKELAIIFRSLAEALRRRQGADGMWTANLSDPASFPAPESSATAFFCYGMAWGINAGLLDEQEFRPVVENAWTGLVERLSATGKVQWGQPIGIEPVAVHKHDSHEFISGAALLAGSEMYRLLQKSDRSPVAPGQPLNGAH